MKKYYSEFAYLFFLGFMSVLGSLLIPIIIGQMVDTLFLDKTMFMTLLVAGIFLTILTAVITYLLEYNAKKTTLKITNRMRNLLSNKYLNGKLEIMERENSGMYAHKYLNNINQINEALSLFLVNFIPGVFTIIISFIIMININVTLAFIILLLTPFSVVATYFISSQSRKYFQEQEKQFNELNSYTKEQMNMLTEIQTERIGKSLSTNFEKKSAKYRNASEQAIMYASLANPVSRLANGLVVVIVTFVACRLILNGDLTIGLYTTMFIYASLFAKPINLIASIVNQINAGLACLKTYQNDLQIKEEIIKTEIQPLSGHIEFKNINFGYHKRRTIISNLSLEINAGEHIAIVGATGSGKTTLINLLLGFYKINSGNILFDDQDAEDIGLASIRENIGVVFQDSWLNGQTVKDEFPNNSPKVQTIINELNLKTIKLNDKISTLSVGQKQIISILKLIIKNPRIIIMDEATSDIDKSTEADINQALNKLTEDKTAITIAHRLDTIQNSDRIIVLRDGMIVETGSHKGLISHKGEYYNIYKNQFKE